MRIKTEIDIEINLIKLREIHKYWHFRKYAMLIKEDKVLKIIMKKYCERYNKCFINRILNRTKTLENINIEEIKLSKQHSKKLLCILEKNNNRFKECSEKCYELHNLRKFLENELTKGKTKTFIDNKYLPIFNFRNKCKFESRSKINRRKHDGYRRYFK